MTTHYAKMIDKCIGEQMDKLMDTFSGDSDYQLDLSTYNYSNFLPFQENKMIGVTTDAISLVVTLFISNFENW